MTIEDFLRLLLRNLLLLLGITALGAAAGYGYSYTQPEVYSASALGYVSATAQTDDEGNPISQTSGNMDLQYTKAQSYLPLFGTRAVGQSIVDELGLDASPDAVAGSLSVGLDPNAPILTVTARAATAEQASAIANAAVEATAQEARVLETGGDENVPVSVQLVPYQTAVVPGAPVSPDRERYLAVGAVAGLLIALAVAWVRDRNDSRIRTAEDLEAAVSLPLLATLPESKELVRGKDGLLAEPKTFAAREAIRRLRTNLRYVGVDEPPRSIVVTSGAPGEGKSVVAGNLARVMARSGQPTLLIDADLRRPRVAEQFGIDGEVGLSQLLAGAVGVEDAVQPASVPLLSLLPSGQVPPNPSELLGSRRMQELIGELSRRFFVVIDAPPVLAVTDAQLLARHADGAIVVAVAGRTRAMGLSASVAAIRDIGATVYGVVLNRISTTRFTRIAYGETGYGYHAYAKYGDEVEIAPETDAVLPDTAEEEAPAAAAAHADGTTSEASRAVRSAGSPEPAPTASASSAGRESPRRPRGRRVATTDRDQG
ncbi:polysaccharide biosynthesis tyrosine autokinase [Brachybacterium saurashtrense]|uniref:non-specific protein-tyrosine kinase n=1 Tax=Brachybacterium saurashtrense TaxID=556288 RepID=A0A345YSE8_9MICO|nr:polysaccharide biosynthesis tyrosine autokinase [Brachybacterium saurashtrense]AXK46850.1 capsular biosynthesis protein [Brachybacterium saurashtrense]RRR22565.1 capsular biosynthesis protein [Brachybacterium saurashtrense]